MAADYSDYIDAHRAQRRLEHERTRQRAHWARIAAHEAAEKLARTLGVRRVYLFGSLARGTFAMRSDIDLAVEGLAPGKLVEATSVVQTNETFEFDVVPLDAMRPGFAEAVQRDGVQLWPR